MMQNDFRVDEYIEKMPPFAQEVLRYFRSVVASVSPEIKETIKWGMPHYEYKGLLCAMAGFKQHCSVIIHKASLIKSAEGFVQREERSAMGHFGKITSPEELPKEKVLKRILQEAMKLNELGIKPEKKKQPDTERKELVVPPILEGALKTNSRAAEVFYGFSYSHKKEYIEWIAEAKTEATQQKRVQTTLDWLNEGKHRNWKYEKC